MDSLLKLHANTYEHIKVDEMSSMPMIKLKNVREFLKFAGKCGTGFVCVYDGEENESGKFFITVNGVIYWIPNQGYNSLYDLFVGSETGFSLGEDYYKYRELKFSSPKEYFEFKKSGFSSKSDYMTAKKLGFIGSLKRLEEEGLAYDDLLSDCKYVVCYTKEGYKDEYKFCSDADVYYYAIEEGFKNFDEFCNALLLEFGNAEAYRDALQNGFQTADKYYDGLEGGFKNIEEYNRAKELGIYSKQSYKLYLKLKNIMSEYRLETFEEAFLYDIIFDIPIGSKITIDELWERLKNDSRIKLTPKERLLVETYNLYNCNNDSEKISDYTQKWFSKRFNSKGELKKYLIHDDILSSILKYRLEQGIFEKTPSTIFSKRYVVIDGINISQNISDENLFDYIKSITDMIKELGFEKIIIMDKSKIPSNEYNDVNLKEVDSKEEAYELIISYVKGLGALVITNETFDSWKQKDKWISKNIHKYIVNYSITNKQINVDKKVIKELFEEMVEDRVNIIKNKVLK
jgi:hypothetical protein